jgi:predicted amidohydrolase
MKFTASQQPVFADIKENLECIIDVLETNKDSDWILTPEGSLSGYCVNQTHEKNDSTYSESLKELETYLLNNRRNLALGTGHIEPDGMPYNQVRVYRQGVLQVAYNKQLLTNDVGAMGEYYYYLPGNTCNYFYLDMVDRFKASALICNDVWAFPRMSPNGNPYFYRQISEAGAKVVFVSVNCCTDEFDETVYNFHESHLRTLSKHFNIHTVVSSACTDMKGNEYNGKIQCPSGIIDPNGEWIKKCKDTGMDSVSVEIL